MICHSVTLHQAVSTPVFVLDRSPPPRRTTPGWRRRPSTPTSTFTSTSNSTGQPHATHYPYAPLSVFPNTYTHPSPAPSRTTPGWRRRPSTSTARQTWRRGSGSAQGATQVCGSSRCSRSGPYQRVAHSPSQKMVQFNAIHYNTLYPHLYHLPPPVSQATSRGWMWTRRTSSATPTSTRRTATG